MESGFFVTTLCFVIMTVVGSTSVVVVVIGDAVIQEIQNPESLFQPGKGGGEHSQKNWEGVCGPLPYL